ncbi:hypothetical protein FACS1894184_05110 [Clostridia bacterium]|nr:hypothetical protein FACS1894184_05110 [Clostridia bacterium]
MYDLSYDAGRIEDAARYLHTMDDSMRTAVSQTVSILKLAIISMPERILNVVDVSRLNRAADEYSSKLSRANTALVETARILDKTERKLVEDIDALPEADELKPTQEPSAGSKLGVISAPSYPIMPERQSWWEGKQYFKPGMCLPIPATVPVVTGLRNQPVYQYRLYQAEPAFKAVAVDYQRPLPTDYWGFLLA